MRTGRVGLRVPRGEAHGGREAVNVQRVVPAQLPGGRHVRQRAVPRRGPRALRLGIDVRKEGLGHTQNTIMSRGLPNLSSINTEALQGWGEGQLELQGDGCARSMTLLSVPAELM